MAILRLGFAEMSDIEKVKRLALELKQAVEDFSVWDHDNPATFINNTVDEKIVAILDEIYPGWQERVK